MLSPKSSTINNPKSLFLDKTFGTFTSIEDKNSDFLQKDSMLSSIPSGTIIKIYDASLSSKIL